MKANTEPLKALLVYVSISLWSGRKFDRKVTNEVDRIHNTHRAGNYHKILLAEEELKKLSSIRNKVRWYFLNNTRPWSDSGDRVIPAEKFLDFSKGLGDLTREFEEAVDKFVDNYPSLKEDARDRLNGMFNEDDYPPARDIRRKFKVNLSINTMPEVPKEKEDWRLKLGIPNANEIAKEIGSQIEQRHERALNDIFESVHKCVARMIETLKEGNDKKFHGTLISNISDLIEELPSWNFTKSPKLAKLTNALKSLVVDPHNLRGDEDLQKEYLEKAKKLAKTYF